MSTAEQKFHFPQDLDLVSPPLSEAWLEVRWKLEALGPPGIMTDPGFPIALGVFYAGVKDKYRVRVDLETSRAPLEITPHQVRHQFRTGEDGWPLLQLGPGVASVNFSSTYDWDSFLIVAQYLRKNLLEAYSETHLEKDLIVLRYKNVEPFNYTSKEISRFLKTKLNTSLKIPKHIPGPTASRSSPTNASLKLAFDLKTPKGTGTITIATGQRREGPKSENKKPLEIVLWQTEIASGGEDAPDLYDEDDFTNWLSLAHSVSHEWFYSFIDGDLLNKYQDKGE